MEETELELRILMDGSHHMNYSFLDSNWNGWWAIKLPWALIWWFFFVQASLGDVFWRPKSASFSGIESGFQVNDKTIKFLFWSRPEWRLWFDWKTYFTRQLSWSWVSYGRAHTIWKTVSWIQVGMADGWWSSPGFRSGGSFLFRQAWGTSYDSLSLPAALILNLVSKSTKNDKLSLLELLGWKMSWWF